MRQKPLICPLHLRQFIRLRKILMENLGLEPCAVSISRFHGALPKRLPAGLGRSGQQNIIAKLERV